MEKEEFLDFEIGEEIKPVKRSIADFILKQNFHFYVPEYQRRYTWTPDNIDSLFDDIYNNFIAKNGEQYFGAIAVGWDEKGLIRIIDGQQRITTSLIVIKAFYDVLKINNKIKDNGESIVTIVTALIEKLCNLLSSGAAGKNESDAFSIILNTKNNYENINSIDYKLIKNTDVYKNYVEIINLFKEQISRGNDSIDFNSLYKFMEYFINEYKFVVIGFKKNRTEEMEIFENLNSKGVDLTTFELIKNALFLKISPDVYGRKEQEVSKVFNKYIDFASDPLFAEKDKDSFDKEEEDFMHAFLKYKFGSKTNVNKNRKSLLRGFDTLYAKNHLSWNDYLDIVYEITKYLKVYKSIKLGINNINEGNVLYDMKNYLNLFSLMPASYPFLFYILDRFSNPESDKETGQIKIEKQFNRDIILCILQLEKWVIGVKQAKGKGDSLGAVMSKLITFLDEALDNGHTIKDFPVLIRDYLAGKIDGYSDDTRRGNSFTTPSDETMEIMFDNEDPNMDDGYQKMLLERIDQYMNDKDIKFAKELSLKDPQLEHIMPQTPDIDSELYKNEERKAEEKGKTLTFEEFNEEHLKYVQLLGNKLILDQHDNGSASNHDTDEKKKNYYGIASAGLEFTVDGEKHTLFDTPIFGFAEVKARNKVLSRELIRKVYARVK